MKKTIYVLLSLLLALTLGACSLDNNLLQGATDEHGVTITPADDVPVLQDAPTLQPTLDAAVYGKDGAQLSILQTGVFYYKGSIIGEDGVLMPMELACGGDSWYMSSQMEGVSIGIMKSGDIYYMVYPDGECCLLLDEKTCKTLDMDISDLDFDTSAISKYEVDPADLLETSDALLDSQIVTCNTYRDSNGVIIKTYIKGDKLLRMTQNDTAGNTTYLMDFEILTGEVPLDKLSPPASYKVYEGTTGLFSFMGKLMKNIDINSFTDA